VNIFYLAQDPEICAQMHLDKHVVKMVIEYAQLLCTAHRLLDGVSVIGQTVSGRKQQQWRMDDYRDAVLYKATHPNHPSAKWCRDSVENYVWLYRLFGYLCDEYTYRYDRIHMTDQKLRNVLSRVPDNAIDKPFVAPWRAMPEEVKVGDDSLLSYRNYYVQNKASFAKWTKREVPLWFTQGLNSSNANL
jgi:hypothetical protein